MKTSRSLFPGLCRSLALALCVGAALAVLTVLPSGVRAEAGAFSPDELERMSTFVNTFFEAYFPDFDMKKSGDDDVLHLGGNPSHPELIDFGIRHNLANNFHRVKDCPVKDCEHAPSVIDAKFVAESVRKYFDLTPKHQSFDSDGGLSWHFDGKLYHFDWGEGDPIPSAQVKRAVREGGVIRMTGDFYSGRNLGRPRFRGTFVVTAKPRKWNGKNTWAILSLKREYSRQKDDDR